MLRTTMLKELREFNKSSGSSVVLPHKRVYEENV